MSSNLRIVKVCEYCKQEFIARKMTSQTCSDACAKRLYKLRQREKAIRRVETETAVKRKPHAHITEEGKPPVKCLCLPQIESHPHAMNGQ